MAEHPLKDVEYTLLHSAVVNAMKRTEIDGEPLPNTTAIAASLPLYASIKIAEATSDVGTSSSLMAIKGVLSHHIGEKGSRFVAAIDRNIDRELKEIFEEIGFSKDKGPSI